MLPFCAVILLATFWALISMVALWRRPVYTFADWQRASERICQEIRRLDSINSLTPLNRRRSRRTCNALLKNLLANTAFIVNVANSACMAVPLPDARLEISPSKLLSQAVALLLQLHYARLRLYWPAVRMQPPQVLTAAENYTCLCMALAGCLERIR
jgi:hypothetical protein